MAEPVILPPRLDLAAAAPLAADLSAALASGARSLSLDAGAVSHLGGLCLQVLIAAARDCGRAGRAFRIDPRSAAFDAALVQFGLPPASLNSEQH